MMMKWPDMNSVALLKREFISTRFRGQNMAKVTFLQVETRRHSLVLIRWVLQSSVWTGWSWADRTFFSGLLLTAGSGFDDSIRPPPPPKPDKHTQRQPALSHPVAVNLCDSVGLISICRFWFAEFPSEKPEMSWSRQDRTGAETEGRSQPRPLAPLTS